MNETQTVAPETESEAKPSEQDKGAQGDDLDTLLSQYEEEVKEPEPKADAPVTRQEMEELRKEVARRDTEDAMQDLAKQLRGDLDPSRVDDDLAIGWAERQAQKDPRILTAWQNRKSNPKGWAKVVERMASDFQGRFTPDVDKEATADREAVAASVRNASTRGSDDFPSPQKIARMSDQEFFELKRRMMGR